MAITFSTKVHTFVLISVYSTYFSTKKEDGCL
nr:MAG TPA: hypothetical protein [Caudoviricetes sp.]